MKINKYLFNIAILTTSLLSFIITLSFYNNFSAGYHKMLLLPVCFLVVYFFVLNNLRKIDIPFTVYGIILMQWIRFVLMPPICAIAGENAGFSYINPRIESIELAITLMIYELMVISLFSLFFLGINRNKEVNKADKKELYLYGNRFVYVMFIVVVLCVMFTVGRNNQLLNFIYIPIQGTERIGDITDTYLVLARQILIIGLFIIFLWSVNFSKIMFEKTKKRIFVNFAIFVAMLNVSVIVGERRTAQIYTAVVCMWILLKSFPLFKKRILFNIGLTAFTVLLLMSIYKFFAAYIQGSYLAAMSNANADIAWWSRTLQSYFFGPENIAITIDFSKSYALNIQNLLFDFTRSFFGISFVMKDKGILTSEMFNTFVYGTFTPTGHVISALGYGFIYFGVLFSPLISILNIMICSQVEKKMYTSKSYEMAFIWGYVLLRFATNLFVSTPPLISYASITLGTGGLLFFTAIILRMRKNTP